MKTIEISKCMGCMEQFEGYPCPKCGFDPGKTKGSEYAMPMETIIAGKYLVGSVLGQGGFGITYIGWDIALERKVAIKEYYPSGQVSRVPGTRELTWYTNESALRARQDGMETFLKEARKMAKLEDIPGVVKVRDLFQENDTAYIVMDFVEGQTLKSLLRKRGPMPWDQAKNIFLPAIFAMERVHQAGLVHRDLSPDNLMITPNGNTKILDLGAAKDLSVSSGASSMQVAKDGFSPIEQYTQRGGSGPWTDVYAMAATIYYSLTGKLPPNAVDRIEKDPIRWDYPALQALPASALKALQNALVVSPTARTQSMAELKEGLFGNKIIPKRPKWLIPAIAAGATVLVVALLALSLGKKPSEGRGPAEIAQTETTATEAATEETTTAETTVAPTPAFVMAPAENLWDVETEDRENQTFWGQTEYKRNEVRTVTFHDTKDGAGSNAWDVSRTGDKSVVAWMNGDALHVAADGIIRPNSDASWMFSYFTNMESLDFGDCFDTSNVTTAESMFDSCTSLTSLDVSSFDTSRMEDMSWMFHACEKLTRLNVSGFDTSQVTNMRSMFNGCKGLATLDVSGFDTSKTENLRSMFSGCESLNVLDVSGFDTARVTDMSYMFYGCKLVNTLDVSGFNTSNVVNLESMFDSCEKLSSLDVSKFDTSNVTDMNFMFNDCLSLTSLDVSGFKTDKVTDMSAMFQSCESLTWLNVSWFNTENVTDMRGMFYHCEGLVSLDVSGFKTGNVTNMKSMFNGCTAVTALDVSGFDTSNVTDMSYMFKNCSKVTSLDLSGFKSTSSTTMDSMFTGCTLLKDVKCTDSRIRSQYNKK